MSEVKICNRCQIGKPLDGFFNDSANKTTGKYSICKECKLAASKAWRKDRREVYNSSMKAYQKKHYYKLRLQRYKMTVEQHAHLLMIQKGTCAICKQPPKGKRPLAIDHCHNSKKVRGLLCYGCNRAISILDSADLLFAAQKYLELAAAIPE